MEPSANQRYSSDGRATKTMKKSKSGGEVGNGRDSPSRLIAASRANYRLKDRECHRRQRLAVVGREWQQVA